MAYVRGRVRASVDALEHLVGGLGTAIAGAGRAALGGDRGGDLPGRDGAAGGPGALRAVRSVADRERARLSRWGEPIPTPGPVPAGLRTATRDPFVRRELGWVALSSLVGLVTGLVGLALPLYAVQYVTFPLYYRLLPRRRRRPGIVWWRIDGLLRRARGRAARASAGWPPRSGSARSWPVSRRGRAGGCCLRRRTSTCRCGSPS